MLEYDNTAFNYFAITLLSFYLVPGLYYAVMEVLRAMQIVKDDVSTSARTSAERQKASKIKDNSTGAKRLRKWPFMANLCLLIPTLLCFMYLVYSVRDNAEMARFDPFQILGIEQNAAEKEIKKAYRKMSLQYHPDKNQGDKNAEDMFMKVAKAYEALTDETSKENYEKFGNPDGKQSLEVSIGLPKIILDNPKVVLVLYLLMIVVIIPIAVGIWYTYSKQYGEKNVKYDTYAAFYQLLTENHRVKNMPEVLAASAESRKINAPIDPQKPTANEEKLAYDKIFQKAKNEKLIVKPTARCTGFEVVKGNILFHMHCYRKRDELIPSFQDDLDEMLNCTPDLIEGLIEICYLRRWLQSTLHAIRFSQCLVQAIWTNSSPFLQLPHFTEKEAASVTKGSKNPNLFASFIRDPLADKSLLKGMSEEQIIDIQSACNVLPHMKIECKLFVEENDEEDFYKQDEADMTEEEKAAAAETAKKGAGRNYNPNVTKSGDVIEGDSIYEQDLVTLRVKMTRENVEEKQKAPPVHAPLFPRPINEAWWLILTEKDTKKTGEPNIHAVERITDQSKNVTHEIRFMAPGGVGSYSFELNVLSETYAGLDEKIEIAFDVLSAADLPDYEAHPEDIELDNEPTLFEQVMTANMDDESDDDDEDDEDEAEERHVISDEEDD